MENDLILAEIIKQNLHWKEENGFKISGWQKRFLFHKLLKFLQNEQILSIVGLRRTGKTTLLRQIIDYLIKQESVAAGQIFFLSFDEAMITSKLALTDYLEAFLERTDEKIMRYVFLDEIQYVGKWQHILKRYYDTRPKIKFFVSGSSSLFMQKKSTESLAGRIYEFRLDPLSFPEYLRMLPADSGLAGEYEKFGVSDLDRFEPDNRDYQWFLATYGRELEKLFEDYLLYRQFPETLKMESKENVLRYIESSIYKKSIEYDIPRLFDVDKVDELKFAYRILINETGNEIEFGKIAGETGIELNTFKKYLNYFHDSLLFDLVYNYSKSVRKSRRLQKKGYIASPNFFTAFHPEFPGLKSISAQYLGKLAETHIYNVLKNKFEYVSFYKKGSKEIDFVCSNEIYSKEGAKLIEVKYANDIKREDFGFIEKIAKSVFKADRFYVFSKRQFFHDKKKTILPCYLIR